MKRFSARAGPILAPLGRPQQRLYSLTAARLSPPAAAAAASVPKPISVRAHPLPAPQSDLTSEEIDKIVRLIENDPRILMEVMANLEPENRRRLIVTGGAMEWFGKETAMKEVERADLDNDREISPKDFDHWFETALKRRQEEQKKRAEAAALAKSAKATEADAGTARAPSLVTPAVAAKQAASSTAARSTGSKIAFTGLALIALEAGLPFVGFGFLDNAAMILAGDMIDGTIGVWLHCSVLASAAMGNVVSGMLGMQGHGLIDKAVQKFNINTPVLTDEQMKDKSVFLAGHIGGTVGILIGLILGMFPLLFLNGDTNEKADYAMFVKWDHNGSGYIELPEFEKVLKELGFLETTEQARKIIDKYGENSKVNFEQYSLLKDDLREGRPIFD